MHLAHHTVAYLCSVNVAARICFGSAFYGYAIVNFKGACNRLKGNLKLRALIFLYLKVGAAILGIECYIARNVAGRQYKAAAESASYTTRPTASGTSSSPKTSKTELATQEEIDRILDKIAERGYEALSKDEKRKLFEFSKK